MLLNENQPFHLYSTIFDSYVSCVIRLKILPQMSYVVWVFNARYLKWIAFNWIVLTFTDYIFEYFSQNSRIVELFDNLKQFISSTKRWFPFDWTNREMARKWLLIDFWLWIFDLSYIRFISNSQNESNELWGKINNQKLHQFT